MENETQKLKLLDEKHNQLMKDWRDHLKPRKKVGVARRSTQHNPPADFVHWINLAPPHFLRLKLKVQVDSFPGKKYLKSTSSLRLRAKSSSGIFCFKSPFPLLQPQLLEDELALKKKEQEDFFRMSECAEYVNLSSPNRLSKFVPYQESCNT